ncbi:MAG: acyl-CoA dehydrogenase, partial [Planctomycetia bacterium]|nr:acyl-CoA dehydrogenase [Planctomycetia bacterium]
PTRGRDVFVSLDTVIGGREGCGKGWTMLMQCLSAGRGIMLPSSSTGGAQLSLRVAGAHASVREQFGMPIGKFEGVQEPLVRSAAHVYSLDALRLSTTLAVDSGEKPAVLSAVAKAYATERLRDVVNDCMDVVAGNAICRGPRNEMANAYSTVPVGITVEGANILTRTLIIFGQGAVRCHPFVQQELAAVESGNLRDFDKAFWGHVGFVKSNGVRTLLHRITGARFASKHFTGSIGRSHQRLTALSSAFALCTDAAMGTLGGSLKRKEHLTGRLADALTWMVVGSVTLKKFQDEGRLARDKDLVDYLLQTCVQNTEEAMGGFLANLPLRPAAWGLRLLGVPGGRRSTGPSDKLADRIGEQLLDGKDLWVSLTNNVLTRPSSSPGLWMLEDALQKVVKAQPDKKALKDAVRKGTLPKGPFPSLIEKGVKAGVIDAEGAIRLRAAEQARQEAITVDHFPAGVAPASSQEVTNGLLNSSGRKKL